ncbi:hypothetical protein ACUXCC_003177 [Cytobacillus horneckiae]|uniref:NIPSNAP family protein n=1 Tax=Cytobacillus horneckiae TaxID=549687 RepID=A0A2N0ZGI6_9BACI|nr:hypothetical protein [Cytobacillus horneckiae]MBN6888254.1 hypothetical protein [Cytobacillus horneckiae]MCM3177110.1 hypothetical protein [Cytobacillus horneckiae]MEC1154809.1 hypothetical protein [Cytobacillus horneckiae]MED2940303.1 hypothetical protein [Cytobacillus horneckiae]PKG28603.1 hypothetical protein CWS20_12725 [Cytobacillus horneckiae]
MTVYVYQTFQIKQEQFQEALENLNCIKNFRNENFSHEIEILSPISGNDHTYSFLIKYEGLAEMELQNKKMFEDEDYKKMISDFFIENIVQGSMTTQIYRTMATPKGKN